MGENPEDSSVQHYDLSIAYSDEHGEYVQTINGIHQKATLRDWRFWYEKYKNEFERAKLFSAFHFVSALLIGYGFRCALAQPENDKLAAFIMLALYSYVPFSTAITNYKRDIRKEETLMPNPREKRDYMDF